MVAMTTQPVHVQSTSKFRHYIDEDSKLERKILIFMRSKPYFLSYKFTIEQFVTVPATSK